MDLGRRTLMMDFRLTKFAVFLIAAVFCLYGEALSDFGNCRERYYTPPFLTSDGKLVIAGEISQKGAAVFHVDTKNHAVSRNRIHSEKMNGHAFGFIVGLNEIYLLSQGQLFSYLGAFNSLGETQWLTRLWTPPITPVVGWTRPSAFDVWGDRISVIATIETSEENTDLEEIRAYVGQYEVGNGLIWSDLVQFDEGDYATTASPDPWGVTMDNQGRTYVYTTSLRNETPYYFSRYDQSGHSEFRKYFTEMGMPGSVGAARVMENNNILFILNDYTETYYDRSEEEVVYTKDPMIVRFDEFGDVVWGRIIDYDEFASFVEVDSGGDLLVATTGHLLKYNESGDLLWTYDVRGDRHCEITAIEVVANNDVTVLCEERYYNSGNRYSLGFVDKVNESGDLLWTATLGEPPGQKKYATYKYLISRNESIYVFGTHAFPPDMLILELDGKSGEVIWEYIRYQEEECGWSEEEAEEEESCGCGC